MNHFPQPDVDRILERPLVPVLLHVEGYVDRRLDQSQFRNSSESRTDVPRHGSDKFGGLDDRRQAEVVRNLEPDASHKAPLLKLPLEQVMRPPLGRYDGVRGGAAFMETEALKNRHDWKTGRREEILKRTPLARIAQPEDMAGPTLFLASDESGFITGQFLLCNGGLAMVGA